VILGTLSSLPAAGTKYLALADIARIHWFVMTGALGAARERKAFPVVGDAIAKFRRNLKVFQTFEVQTRLMGWDRRWGFIEPSRCAPRSAPTACVEGKLNYQEYENDSASTRCTSAVDVTPGCDWASAA